jgi:carbamoyl-phosphate synthase large subunit
MRDKWESYEFARRHGLPFAPTLHALQSAQLDAFIAQHGFPLIAKPARGFASRDVLLIANAEQARLALAREAYVLQPFLGRREEARERLDRFAALGTPLFHTFEGWKHGMQLMIAPDGTLAGMLCALQQMRQGVTDRVEIDPDPASRALAQRCADVFAAAGWRGPLNIQCQRDEDGLRIHEFSGRVTGATEARLLLGYDELGLIVRHFAGCELPDDPRAAAAFPRVRRTYRSVAPRAATLDALERTGRWSSMRP